MSKLKGVGFCLGAILILSTVAVNGHLNLFLNQHEVMRLLGEFAMFLSIGGKSKIVISEFNTGISIPFPISLQPNR